MNRSLILIAAYLCFLGMSSAQSIQDGIKQMENENYSAALQTFSGLAKSDPKNPIYQYYIGEVQYALENPAEARKAYEKGLAVNSNCDQCHIGLGRLDFDSGKFDEGQKHLDLALKGNSKNAQILALVGGAYLYGKSRRPDLALPYLEKARDLDPKQAKFWIALGDAYQLKGELGDAMTAYETAVEKDKTDLETYVKMSRIWADGKQLDLAIERLEKAIEIKSDYALAYKNLYELYIRTRRFDKVVPVLDKYVALSGSDVDAKVRLVKFLSFQAKDYDRAIAEGKVLVKEHPNEYTLHRWLAWSYYETGKYDSSLNESYALFEKINADTSNRKLYPSDVEYAAKAAIKLNLADTADQFYLKLIAMEPERAGEISTQVAKAFYDAKKFDRAEQWYARKAEYTPLTLNEMVYLGTAQKIQNKLVEADTTYAKILSLSPKYDYGWFIRARINNDLDTTKKLFLAKPYFEKYLELASADPIKNKDRLIEANLYMVYYYAQTSEIELAKSYCNMVLNLEPNHEVANEYLKILSGQHKK